MKTIRTVSVTAIMALFLLGCEDVVEQQGGPSYVPPPEGVSSEPQLRQSIPEKYRIPEDEVETETKEEETQSEIKEEETQSDDTTNESTLMRKR